ncbi:MAG TPA: DUF721 domain-containing protein [Polyangiaceae bacterium LLY-WYZ-15_(1-7)]|nr:hypothetical protein [Myxococcales bacterium]MAT29548.1 hypothetical protein [Sandaracinus sp.]HJK95295.1 DUF721 domain-containing protein [Polyangiaceae bacterium LLY-WYZ-15_(1-7)]MBJ71819.1 hypothetical protein [Sandaracinus sp.]HJL06044.1 DUF721 domain-containing protein [Polyangiaceae bacterium LLY-WYZ-15_(1-7)]
MARRRRKGKLHELGELVRRVHPAPEQVDAARVFAWWGRALPKRIVDAARPTRLERGVLWVNTKSSAWAQELHFMHDELLERVRKAAPRARVHMLRFRVGPLPEMPVRRPIDPPKPRRVALTALPDELGRALARVGDDALRRAIAAAATTSLTCEPDDRPLSKRER